MGSIDADGENGKESRKGLKASQAGRQAGRGTGGEEEERPFLTLFWFVY